jgi:acyl-CoA synthetase (AMP-forming)/AMP-acid ligase II
MFRRYSEADKNPERMKVLSALPPSHVGGSVEIMGMGIVGGAELIFLEQWKPYPVLEITQQESLPFIAGVPTMYAILLSLADINKFDLSCVKLGFLSGEKVSLELLLEIEAKLCKRIINGYGSTEAGAEVAITTPDDDLGELGGGYVGQPLESVEIKIVDESDATVSSGASGEILVRGPLTIKGYYKMPEEDKKSFTEDGFVRTGDLGYMNKNGGLYIDGRIKQIIRVGSYTVMPIEIEEVVLENKAIAMAAAIGVPDKILGEVVWLIIVLNIGKSVDEDDIFKLCSTRLANFKVPKKILIRDEIPVTRIGKADRMALRNEIIKTIEE